MTLSNVITELYPWITGAIGGFMGAALLLPTKLGEAVIKFRYDRNLEDFKSRQSRDLETVKERLNHLADRGKRSNELEFAAVTAVWVQFIEAYAATDAAIVSFVQIPDLKRMNDHDRDSYLDMTELSAVQKDQVRTAQDPTDMLSKILVWRIIARAGEQIFLTHKALRTERVFLSEELRIEFLRMLDIVSRAYTQRKIEHERPNSSTQLEGVSEFYKQGASGVDNLAAMVRERLVRTEIA